MDALAAFRQSLVLNPHNAQAHLGAGNALREMRDRAGARAAFQAALALDPSMESAHRNLALVATEEGNARKDLGDLDGALALWKEALAHDAGQPAALLNSGSAALERGDLAAARAFYGRALQARPDLADAHYGLGVISLFEHDFARGWAGYERRFDTTPPVAAVSSPHLPRLDLERHADVRRLAVRAEQGLGDQILFSTLLPDLARRGIGGVVEIDPRLAPIYRRSVPGFEYNAPLHGCGFELPIGSLARLFRPSVESFDAQPRALLKPDPARVDAIARALGPGRKVAVSWRSFQGKGRVHVASRKSFPLEHFGVLAHHGVRLVDVQYGPVDEERRAFDARYPGLRAHVPGLDLRDDLEGIFAAIEACDHVITASNVTAHFAGAIGKPASLLYLGANSPFHYWVARNDGRSLWYPSVEIVTDPSWKSWDTVFDELAARVRRALA